MNDPKESQASMNPNGLYREEIFTDRTIGSIKKLIPVTASGESDTSRDCLYLGETQVLLGNTPLPINFEIDATSIGEAAEKFGDLAKQEAENTVKRLQEMQREMQNQIVVPGQGGGPMGGGMGGMGGPGGMPGGGKIQIP